MSIRNIVIAVIVVMAFLGGIVWQSQMQKAQPPAPAAGGEQSAPAMPGGGEQGGGMGGGMGGGAGAMGGQQVAPPPPGASAGLAWTVPANWKPVEASSMRLATYQIPATGGDKNGGECAVFFFGAGQGGGIEENLNRWVGQFENASAPDKSQGEVAGFKVHRVHVTGTYTAGGMMMQSAANNPGYALLGAIVEGPNGNVFFKLTGPKATVDAAKGAFEGMLKTMKKG